MREPTPLYVALAWWKAALSGIAPAVTEDPQCGFFKRKLTKGGPFVPARIWLDQSVDPETGELTADEVLRCEVNGRPMDAVDQWIWLCSNPITETDFRLMTDRAAWTAAQAPDHPIANPTQAVDWSTSRVPF